MKERDEISTMLMEFQKKTQNRFREIGVIDGLMLAHDLLKEHHNEAAGVPLRAATALLNRLNAAIDAEVVIERVMRAKPANDAKMGE